MELNNLLQADTNLSVEKCRSLYISDRTVRFGSDVYQFRNVTGFGIGELKSKNIIPNIFIFILTLFGFITLIKENYPESITIFFLAFIIYIYNRFKPPTYGLKLSLNSGENKLFITEDLAGLKQVVSKLYEFMESNEEGSYVVKILDRSIKIDQSCSSFGVGYAEKVNAQQLGGTIHNDS